MKGKRREGTHRRKWLLVLLLILLALPLLFSVGAVAYVQGNFRSEVDLSLFSDGSVPRSPQFFAYRFTDRAEREGSAVALSTDFYAQQKHDYLTLDEIPQAMIDAFIAIEDKRFFSHSGVDLKRTLAAGVNYLLGFSDTFGASTITQQLVKNMTGNNEITVRRKLQEILYATDLEKKLSKEQILELYLNVIHFSDNCNGIAAAAEHYYSKSASELSVSECATIAAITNNPSYYNPIRNAENNLYRRNLILKEMYTQGFLSEREYQEATDSSLSLCVDSLSCRDGINSWYADMVIDDVISDLMEKYDLSRSAASHMLYTKGLRIDVAMDEEMQKIVEEYYRTAVRLPKSGENSASSAIILIDSSTGDILAVAGACGEKTGNHLQNFATQTKRSPGSTIKPISVYAPALEEGLITWGSVFDDVPTDFSLQGHTVWPQNATRVYRGLTDVAYAVAHSTNTVAIRTLRLLGNERAFSYARDKFHLNLVRGGVSDQGDAALGLGQLQKGVTLREITSAYTVFADNGSYHPWRSYYRVLDADGTVLLSNADRAERVLSRENAAIMTKLLEGVVSEGTSGRITLSDRMECAGKTGTSGNDHDRWFIGYTPEVICGVWCGYPYPEPLNERHLCTTIWNGVMGKITEEVVGKTRFEVPDNVIRCRYCADSGMLPCEICALDARGERTRVGWFVRGTEPTECCQRHVLCAYDAERGGILHGGVLGENWEAVALIDVERHFPIEICVTDAQFVWRGNPMQYPINEDPTKAYFASELEDHCGISNVELPFNRSAMPPPEELPEEYLIPIPWEYKEKTRP